MRSEIFEFNPKVSTAPVAVALADNTAQVGAIIDTQGYNSLSFVIITGTLADADATFAVTMDHGNDSGLSDAAAVPADQMAGTLANAGFTFAADSACRKIGYIGSKRYVRLTITPSGNTGAAPLSVVALQGEALEQPTPAIPT